MKKVISNAVIIVGIISIILAIIAYILKSNSFSDIAIFSFSITSLLIGLDAILSKKIIMPSRYSRKLSETYIGIAAIAQGITFLILAVFLFYLNYLILTNTGQNFFNLIIKRPGAVLIIIGIYISSYSIIAFVGYKEQKQTTKFVYYLDLIASRLLPGIILLLWGLGFTVLGIIEISNPTYFDSIGGGFIELLFSK